MFLFLSVESFYLLCIVNTVFLTYLFSNLLSPYSHCWCHNPVSTFSLCLLAKAYDLSFALVKCFSQMEDISVGFLMQLDKLVFLLESPIFVHLRLQLLDVQAPYHAPLLKSIYGVLMCLPQGDAFRLLNDRLATVCNLRDNLGVSSNDEGNSYLPSIVSQQGLDMDKLIQRFDNVTHQHRRARIITSTNNSELLANEIVVNPPERVGGLLFASPSPSSSQAGTNHLASNSTLQGKRRVAADAGATTRITVHRSTR
jgi:hypothetical protein